MSAIPTKQIDGDVAVGRNVSAGGDANVQGNARVGHDLIVEGWLEAKNIKGVNKGLFASAAALREAYPQPHDGWFAGVSASEADITALGLTVQQGKALFRMYVGCGGDWVCEPINKLYEIVVDNTMVTQLRTKLTALEEDLTALEQKHAAEVLELQRAVWALEVGMTASPTVIEVGKATSVTASWTARYKGSNVLGQSTLTFNGGSGASTLTAGTSTKTVSLSPTSPGTTTLNITVGYNGMSASASMQVRGVYPSYLGKIAGEATVTAALVTSLTKTLNISKSMTQSGQTLTNQRLVYAYPKSYGALTDVRDGNNFSTLNAYTRTELQIGGVDYYVYAMTSPVTASGVKQIYS